MPATARTPRAAWVGAGLDALAAGGPDAVRVEALAKALGVTKGGFYWHFDDRPALLAAILDHWERTSVDEVIAQVDAAAEAPRARLQALFDVARRSGGFVRTDLAVRDWARRDDDVAARLRRVDGRRMAYMRELFGGFVEDPEEVEARCLLAFSLFVGSHFIAARHRSRSRAAVAARALELLAT